MRTDDEWRVENYIDRLLPTKGELSDEFNFKPRRIIKLENITDELLESCYVFMAQMVAVHGNKNLPIFERLHREIEERKEQKEMLKIALDLYKNEPENH